MSAHKKDQTRVAAGLKAAVHNPNVSEEAKESAAERLHEMGTDKDQTRVAAGLKAAVHNPNVSEEAKKNATERLHEMGADTESTSKGGHQPETIDGKDAGNVLRGYKATLHNPHVSEEAKEKAEQILEEHGAI